MDILDTVTTYWGWTGIEAERVIAINEFGNLIIKDAQGKFWRLCPEDVYCDIVAQDDNDYNELVKDEEFNQDWFMEVVLQKAVAKFGELKDGDKYTLAVPEVLGGTYGGANLKMVPHERIISFYGELAKEINDAADGAKIKVGSIV